jgi:hypothetical protein
MGTTSIRRGRYSFYRGENIKSTSYYTTKTKPTCHRNRITLEIVLIKNVVISK